MQAQKPALIARVQERLKRLFIADDIDLDPFDAGRLQPAAILSADGTHCLLREVREPLEVLREPDTFPEAIAARLGWIFVPLHRG